jgi:hypothetical protein
VSRPHYNLMLIDDKAIHPVSWHIDIERLRDVMEPFGFPERFLIAREPVVTVHYAAWVWIPPPSGSRFWEYTESDEEWCGKYLRKGDYEKQDKTIDSTIYGFELNEGEFVTTLKATTKGMSP